MSMRVAVTGYPDVGKSTIIRIIECELPKVVLAGGDVLHAISKKFFPEVRTDFSRRCYQKALYNLQKEYETSMTYEQPEKLLLCDHGSLDLLAFWPGNTEDFFSELNTSIDKELSRYEYVIHINGFDTKKASRLPSVQNDPKSFWQKHPHFLEIPSQKGFSFSYMETTKIINSILCKQPFEEIKTTLKKAIQQPAPSGFLKVKNRKDNEQVSQ